MAERTERIEQRLCIKFCVKLGYTAAETTRLIQKAFKDDPISVTQTKLWHRRFRDGRESVLSDARSGRPTTSKTPENIDHVRQAYGRGTKKDRVTMRKLAEELGIQKSTVHEIVSGEFGQKRETTKFKEKKLQDEDPTKNPGYEEQQTCIKFCFSLGHSCAETVQMILGAFSEDAISEEDIETLFQSFNSVKDEEELKQEPAAEDSEDD